MAVLSSDLIRQGASGASTGFTINQSIRFDTDNSPRMTRTFGTPSDGNKWTLSAWSKLGKPGNGMRLLEAGGSSGSEDFVGFGGSSGYEKLYFWKRTSSSYNYNLTSTQMFRDHSAWYHVVYVFDSSNTIITERMKAYVNGQRITDFSTETYPSSGLASRINTAVEHRIGNPVYSSSNHADGYIAEMHFLDGYAYGPEFFGEFKEDTDIWIPKDYTGSYGNNGFHIDGRDSSDLGDDESGNGNDFTTNGLVATDQRTDSPTNNHATWNALLNRYPSYANGNIDVTMTTSNKWAKTVMNFTLPNTGTWYWEGQEFDLEINPATAVGIVDSDVENLIDKDLYNRFTTPMSTFTGLTVYSGPGQSIDTYLYKNGVNTSTSATPILSSSRLGFLWEPENNRFTIYDDGSQHTQFTSINAGNYVFGVQQATGGVTLNFRLFVEANDWTQTPSGITSANALNTANIGS